MEVNKKPLKRINSQKENIIKGLNPPENILGNEEDIKPCLIDNKKNKIKKNLYLK